MLVLKNKSTMGITTYSNEKLDLKENYTLFLHSIGAIDNNENDLYIILYASLVDGLMRDNCYYGLSFLNDMTDIDTYMESVYSLFLLPYLNTHFKDRNLRNYAKNAMMNIKNRLLDVTTKYFKRSFLEWLETVGLLLQDRVQIKDIMMFPISQEWNNTSLTIGYASETPSYTKAIVPTPDIYNTFVTHYFKSNYNETLPANLLNNCLVEFSNISYGEPIDDIISRVMKKALDTIELDQFDSDKVLTYYSSIDKDAFSQDIYLVIVNLLDHFHKLITSNYLYDRDFYIERYDKRNIVLCFKEH